MQPLQMSVILAAVTVFFSARAFEPPPIRPYYTSPDGKWSILRTRTGPDPDNPNRKERIEKSTVHVLVDATVLKEQLLQVLIQNRDKWVCAVDNSGVLYDYLLRDNGLGVQFAKWTNQDAPKYMIPSPIGAYRTRSIQLGGEVAQEGWSLSINARKLAFQDFSDDKGHNAYVILGADFDPVASDRLIHDIFEKHMCEDFEIVRKGDSTVIETKKGFDGRYMVTWLAKDVFVSISAAKNEPIPVVMAYLQRYPSILPTGLSFDPQSWAIKQLELSIVMMKGAIEEPDDILSARGAPYRFSKGRQGVGSFDCREWWDRYSVAQGQLHARYIKTNPQDFEAYRKGLIEARTKTVAKAEEMLKIARAEGVRFVQVKPDERRVQIGRTPEDIEREKREKKQQVLLNSIGYYGGGGFFVLLVGYVLLRLRASRTRQTPINTTLAW